MFAPQFASNRNFGLKLCRLLEHLQDDPNVDAACQDLAVDFTGVWTGTRTPADAITPRLGIYKTDDAIIFAFLGATTVDLVARFVQACNLRPDPQGTMNLHALAWSASVAFAPGYFLLHKANEIPNVIFTGHSYGGLFAACYASLYKTANPLSDPKVVTFGSPRGSYDGGRQALTGVDYIRWNRYLDPVPFMPPHPGEANIMRNLAPAGFTTNWSAMNHAGIGLTISGLFNVTTEEVPTPVPNVVAANLAGFISSNETLGAFEHSLRAYVGALAFIVAQQRANRAEPAPIPPMPLPPINPIANDPHIELIHDAIPAAQAAQFASATTNNPRRRTYYARKSGQTHGVYCGTEFIVACRGSRAARKLAQTLNTALNRWNTSIFGDADALEQSIVDNFVGGD